MTLMMRRRSGAAEPRRPGRIRVALDTWGVLQNAAMSNHGAGEGMGNWYFKHPGYALRNLLFDSTGRAYVDGTSSTAQYLLAPQPVHADYEVRGSWIVLGSTSDVPGVTARTDSSANTMWIARYVPPAVGGPRVEIIKLLAGAATTTQAAVTAWAANSNHSLTIRLVADQITLLVDDVVTIGPITDNGIPTVGHAGIRMSGGAGVSSTAGFHMTRLEVTDLSGWGKPANREPAARTPPGVVRRSVGRVNQRNQLNNSTDSVCTFNGNQYAVWVNQARNPIVGKRALPNGDWATFDLSTVAGNPLVTPSKEDSHNTYSIAVSGDGRVHVSGNHHDVALRYVRSSNPEDISAWTAAGAPAGWPSSVTYPDFALLSNGDLLFVMRGGISGNGDYRVARYDRTTQTWGTVTTFLSGSGTPPADTFSPYITTLVESPAGDGWVHAFWHWRKGTAGAGATGNDAGDLCHAKTNDGGVTWRDMAGNALTLPIGVSTSPLVLDTAASGSGLFIGPSTDVDTQGRPHCGFLLYDANGKTQAMHAWHDGTTWHVDQVTNWGYRLDLTVGVVDSVIARPQVMCLPNGQTWMLLRHNVEKGGKFYLVEVTSGGEHVVWDTPAYYNEVHGFDRKALKDGGDFNFFVAPAAPVDTANADMPTVEWAAVNGFVVSAQPAQFLTLPPP